MKIALFVATFAFAALACPHDCKNWDFFAPFVSDIEYYRRQGGDDLYASDLYISVENGKAELLAFTRGCPFPIDVFNKKFPHLAGKGRRVIDVKRTHSAQLAPDSWKSIVRLTELQTDDPSVFTDKLMDIQAQRGNREMNLYLDSLAETSRRRVFDVKATSDDKQPPLVTTEITEQTIEGERIDLDFEAVEKLLAELRIPIIYVRYLVILSGD
jgi:hypothetical protein